MSANLAWATLLVDALAQAGLRGVHCAGSRSTPLTLAFDRHPDVDVFLHLDERRAGFFALGMALTTDRPVALVCTSGTAAAEFFAAVIEARQSHVPLLVLTSDRPHELRHSGANQTIDQVKLYGDQVLWSVDLPVPAADATDVELRNLVATAARAYAIAAGIFKGRSRDRCISTFPSASRWNRRLWTNWTNAAQPMYPSSAPVMSRRMRQPWRS
ncbi:MAG: thiamine pyrophosphate-binding protein [Caldilineaceae bacterium]